MPEKKANDDLIAFESHLIFLEHDRVKLCTEKVFEVKELPPELNKGTFE